MSVNFDQVVSAIENVDSAVPTIIIDVDDESFGTVLEILEQDDADVVNDEKSPLVYAMFSGCGGNVIVQAKTNIK